MISLFSRFIRAESGAVTVDWVVLTAAITGLGLGSATLVRTGTSDVGADIETSLTGAQVASLDCMGSNGGPAGFECYSGPTIASMGMGWGYAWMPACYGTPDGGMTCSGSGGSEMTQEYHMSDGSVYREITRTENGVTTVIWTDSDGNPVDEPPPMA